MGILNKVKNLALPIVATSAFVVSSSLAPFPKIGVIETQQPANAQAFSVNLGIDGNQLGKDAYNFIYNGLRGRFVQTYFGYIQPSGSQWMRNNYGSSANSKAHRICTDYYASRSGYGWFVYPNSWWYIQTRFERDRYNCFYRRYY